MISKHLKDIKKLLKAYHKKYNWEGEPVKKETKKRKEEKIMDAFTQAVIIIVIVFIMIEIFKWYR
jgi:hypothetical protein